MILPKNLIKVKLLKKMKKQIINKQKNQRNPKITQAKLKQKQKQHNQQ